jgi:hypothetical protein
MPPEPNVRVHTATTEDAAFIVQMARQACVIDDWPLPDADSEDTQSLLPGSSDTTVVSTQAPGVRVGAVWTFLHNPPLLVDTYGVSLPEITIAVVPEMRGAGVGCAHLERSPTKPGGTVPPAEGFSSDRAKVAALSVSRCAKTCGVSILSPGSILAQHTPCEGDRLLTVHQSAGGGIQRSAPTGSNCADGSLAAPAAGRAWIGCLRRWARPAHTQHRVLAHSIAQSVLQRGH